MDKPKTTGNTVALMGRRSIPPARRRFSKKKADMVARINKNLSKGR